MPEIADLTLGEYLRRLRRDKRQNLQQLADETGISYTHLSRIENDSTVPSAETVAKLHAKLGGDLKFMLEKARCLPREILDRIASLDTVSPANTLKRAAGPGGEPPSDRLGILVRLARESGLGPEESKVVAHAVVALFALPTHQRAAVAALISSLASEGGGGAG
jgi:transcriptional regulator with XRE-family HTH domain